MSSTYLIKTKTNYHIFNKGGFLAFLRKQNKVYFELNINCIFNLNSRENLFKWLTTKEISLQKYIVKIGMRVDLLYSLITKLILKWLCYTTRKTKLKHNSGP